MSRFRVGALVLALSVFAGREMAAQVLDTAQLHTKADSLLSLWREADALGEVQQAVRDARHQRATQVTRATAVLRGEHPVRAGDLMIIADYPDSIPLVAAATRAWSILSTTYGSQATSLVAQAIRLTVMFSNRQMMRSTAGRRVPRNVTVEELERTLLGMAGQPRVDARFSRWLGNTPHPVFDTAADRASVYVQLVTAGSTAATSCFSGSITGCAAALQLAEDSEFYLTVYDAAERRAAVAGARSRDVLEPTARATYAHCVDDAADSACIDFLRGITLPQIPQPLTFEARNLLVSTTEVMGGPGAYDRLMADTTAPVITRLERAANAPIDKVVATWRANIIAARPRATHVPARDVLLAVGWTGIIAFGAIRSTRWRLI
jgi:hypothetical protein